MIHHSFPFCFGPDDNILQKWHYLSVLAAGRQLSVPASFIYLERAGSTVLPTCGWQIFLTSQIRGTGEFRHILFSSGEKFSRSMFHPLAFILSVRRWKCFYDGLTTNLRRHPDNYDILNLGCGDISSSTQEHDDAPH